MKSRSIRLNYAGVEVEGLGWRHIITCHAAPNMFKNINATLNVLTSPEQKQTASKLSCVVHSRQ